MILSPEFLLFACNYCFSLSNKFLCLYYAIFTKVFLSVNAFFKIQLYITFYVIVIIWKECIDWLVSYNQFNKSLTGYVWPRKSKIRFLCSLIAFENSFWFLKWIGINAQQTSLTYHSLSLISTFIIHILGLYFYDGSLMHRYFLSLLWPVDISKITISKKKNYLHSVGLSGTK